MICYHYSTGRTGSKPPGSRLLARPPYHVRSRDSLAAKELQSPACEAVNCNHQPAEVENFACEASVPDVVPALSEQEPENGNETASGQSQAGMCHTPCCTIYFVRLHSSTGCLPGSAKVRI